MVFQLDWMRGRLALALAVIPLTMGVVASLGRWEGTSGWRVAELASVFLWVLCVLACVGAAGRSGAFGRQFWMLMGTAFGIAGAGALAGAYGAETIPWIFFFLFPVPLGMALLWNEEEPGYGMDWRQALDFLQMVIIALLAYLVFAGKAAPADGFRMHLWRDFPLAGIFLLRGFFSGKREVRALLQRWGFYFLMVGAAALLLFQAGMRGGNAGSGWMQWLEWVGGAGAIGLAAMWKGKGGEEESTKGRGWEGPQAWAQYVAIFLPMAALALATQVSKQEMTAAWLGVGASFACAAMRVAASQRKLNRATEMVGRAFRSSPNAIWIGTLAEGRLLEVNEAFERMTGYASPEAIGKTVRQLNMWVDETERGKLMAALQANGRVKDLEAQYRKKSGEIGTVLVSAEVMEIGGEACLLAHGDEITEKKRAEEEKQRLLMREAEAKHTAEVFGLANLAFTQGLNLQGVLETFLEHVHRLVPYDTATVILAEGEGKFVVRARQGLGPWMESGPPVNSTMKEGENPLAGRVMGARKGVLIGDTQREEGWQAPRGCEYIRNVIGVPLLAGGKMIGMYCLDKAVPDFFSEGQLKAAESLSAQTAVAIQNAQLFEGNRKAEAALRQSQARYQDLVENANDIIFTLDLKERFTSLNRVGEKLTGYKNDPATDVRIADLTAPEHLERARMMLGRALHGEVPETFEIDILTKTGQRVTLEMSGRALHESGQVYGVQAIARDVTERKQMEMRLRQSQKMEAIGLLAGGVAHDFNNLLAVICGQAELLSLESEGAEGLRARAEQIVQAGQKAASLTRQLLAFSRKQVLQPRVLDLNGHVADTVKLLRRLIGEHIVLVTKLAPELGKIKADPGQVEQVIINLAVNARDAMEKGGTLLLETGNEDVGEEFAKQNAPLAAGKYVKLTVSDTGTGIAEESLPRVFEPFFTTKAPGKGTGLGLATVYGIVQQSGGHIQVRSEEGKGTTFNVYFPRVEGAIAAVERRGSQKMVATRRGETILLAEDEAVLREMVRGCLEQAGYSVLAAQDGREALEISAGYAGTIDVLLTDVVMPGMSGLELAKQLREKRPGTRVVYVSGYADGATVPAEVAEHGAAFLEKPFRLLDLTSKLREILDRAGKPRGEAAGS